MGLFQNTDYVLAPAGDGAAGGAVTEAAAAGGAGAEAGSDDLGFAVGNGVYAGATGVDGTATGIDGLGAVCSDDAIVGGACAGFAGEGSPVPTAA